MRHIFIALAFLIGTANAQTLTETYIELSITDTIPVKTKQITYDFTPSSTEMGTDAVYEEDTDWEKLQEKIAEENRKLSEKLTKELSKEGFTVTDIPLVDGYDISSYDDGSSNATGVRITVPNEAELKRLVAYLRANSKGDGSVHEWEQDVLPVNDQEFMTKLFEKAKVQADALAKMGGRKLGKLISVSDPASASTGYSFLDTIIGLAKEEMMKESRWKMATNRSKTLVFRFGLED